MSLSLLPPALRSPATCTQLLPTAALLPTLRCYCLLPLPLRGPATAAQACYLHCAATYAALPTRQGLSVHAALRPARPLSCPRSSSPSCSRPSSPSCTRPSSPSYPRPFSSSCTRPSSPSCTRPSSPSFPAAPSVTCSAATFNPCTNR